MKNVYFNIGTQLLLIENYDYTAASKVILVATKEEETVQKTSKQHFPFYYFFYIQKIPMQ